MKKILTIFVMMIFILTLQAQTKVHKKIELSFDYVEMYIDTVHIASIKTHTNFDFYDNGYFMNWSSGSERVYHFMYSESCGYNLNRMTFKQTNINYVYVNDFQLFVDSIGVDVSGSKLRIFNKDLKILKFHN